MFRETNRRGEWLVYAYGPHDQAAVEIGISDKAEMTIELIGFSYGGINPRLHEHLEFEIFKTGTKIRLHHLGESIWQTPLTPEQHTEVVLLLTHGIQDKSEDNPVFRWSFIHEDGREIGNWCLATGYNANGIETPTVLEVQIHQGFVRVYTDEPLPAIEGMVPILAIDRVDTTSDHPPSRWWTHLDTVTQGGSNGWILEASIPPARAIILLRTLRAAKEVTRIYVHVGYASPDEFAVTQGHSHGWHEQWSRRPWHQLGWQASRIEQRPRDAGPEWPEDAVERAIFEEGVDSLLGQAGETGRLITYFDTECLPVGLPGRLRGGISAAVALSFYQTPITHPQASYTRSQWAEELAVRNLLFDPTRKD